MTTRKQNADHWNYRAHFAMSRVPVLTLLWVAACVAVSISARLTPLVSLTDHFVDFGAKSTAAMTESGEWWRLLSANFLHAGWLHLSFNCAIIAVFGGVLENVYRRSDAMLVLFGSALGTTVASTLTSDGIGLGGSGVAIGCLATVSVFALRHLGALSARHRRTLLGVALPVALIYLWLGYRVMGVDNAGHLGGALIGVLCGLWFEARLLTPSQRRWPSTGWLFVLAYAAVALVFSAQRRSSFDWITVRPTDDFAADVPVTFEATHKGPSFRAFDNGIGTSLLIEHSDRPDEAFVLESALDSYRDEALARFAESEDIAGVDMGQAQAARVANVPALVLPLTFTGPRGETVSWHVWLAGERTLIHAVWTARAKRRAQNEVLFRSWLQRLSLLH